MPPCGEWIWIKFWALQKRKFSKVLNSFSLWCMDRWTLKWQLSETGDTDSGVIGLQCSAPAYRINSCLAGVWAITISQRGDGQLFAPRTRYLSHPWLRWCNFMTNKQRISYFVTRRSLVGGEETVGELKINVPMKHELGILWSIILFTAITFKTLKSNRTTHFLFLRYIFHNVGFWKKCI